MYLRSKNKEYYAEIKRYTCILKDFPDNIHILAKRAYCKFGHSNWRVGHSDWKKAAKDFELLTKLKPDNADFWGMLGQACVHGKLSEQAVMACSRAIELDPDYESFYMHRAWAYRQLKQWDASIMDYTKAIELDEKFHNSGHSAKYRGELYMELKEYEKAAEDFTYAISKQRFWEELYWLRSDAYMKAKQYEKVIENANIKMSKSPSKHFLKQRSIAYVQLGQKDNAEADIALIKRLTEKQKKEGKTNENEEAERQKKKLVKTTKTNHERLQKEKKRKEIIKKLTAVIKKDRKDFKTYYERGLAFMEGGEYKKAIKDFNFIIRFNKESYDVYIYRGVCYDKINQIKKTLNDYTKAIAINPNLSDAYGERAMVYSLLGDIEKEIADMEKINSLDKKYVNSRRLAILYEETGNYVKAVEKLTKNISCHKLAFFYNGSQISIFDREKIKKLSAAIDGLPKAESKLEEAALYYLRANAYEESRLYKYAIYDYTKVIELKPDMMHAYLQRALANSASIKNFPEYYIDDSKVTSEELVVIDSMIADLKIISNYESQSDSSKATILVELGNLYNLTGKYEIAIESFNKAMEIYPEHNRIIEERSKSYKALKNYQAALDDLNCINENNLFYEESIERRGDIFFIIGEFKKAAEDYSKLIEIISLYSKNVLSRLLEKRSKCYQELGEEEKAKEDFERAEELENGGNYDL